MRAQFAAEGGILPQEPLRKWVALGLSKGAAMTPLPTGYCDAVEAYLRRMPIPYESLAGTIIAEHLDAGSDLLGAVLVLWSSEAGGGAAEVALPTAVAIELFRRAEGLRDRLLSADPPWGIGQSLNAGDALHALAYRALIGGTGEPRRRLRSSAVVTAGFVEEIERRNGALLWAGMEAGAILGGASERLARRLRRAGRLLAAACSDESYAAKAVAAVDAAGVAPEHSATFAGIARYVVSQAA